MNRLSERANVIGCLVEGNSIRATRRITGASKNTVVGLLVRVGEGCAEYQGRAIRDPACKRVPCDEIWSFCYAKQKNLPPEKQGVFGYGDVWTWTALDAETKLPLSFMIGDRDRDTAWAFIDDLAGRLSNRVQLTTDSHFAYLDAVKEAFGSEIDYAMLQKLYGASDEGQRHYSPAKCIGTRTEVVQGTPDPAHISTRFVERQNLTMRMSMRRLTRLTNGFSKKVENLTPAVAPHFMHSNFARPHQSLTKAIKGRITTPAMAAGLAARPWTLEEIVNLEKSN
jgi:IS1 family transposase